MSGTLSLLHTVHPTAKAQQAMRIGAKGACPDGIADRCLHGGTSVQRV